MPLNRNNTVLPEGTVVHFVNGEGMTIQEERMPVGENIQFGRRAQHYFVDEAPNIHRAEPYVRLNRDAEATFTATNTTINENLLRQLVDDFEARISVPEYQPRMFERQDLETLAWLNIDDESEQTDKELADVDPDEFDKILSA